MGRDVMRARALIDKWRQQNADQLDPIRFRLIDALERRSANHDGELRRVLDERLSSLLSAYAQNLAATTVKARPAIERQPSPRPLGELLDHLADTTSKRDDAIQRVRLSPDSPDLPVLPALEDFRKTWSAVLTDSRMQQSRACAPTHAGPLNSAALVHRSIALMREVSPGYLQHFLAYVDELSWLEKIQASVGGKPDNRSARPAKRARKKSGGMTPENVG